jgi:hypothetical protein
MIMDATASIARMNVGCIVKGIMMSMMYYDNADKGDSSDDGEDSTVEATTLYSGGFTLV